MGWSERAAPPRGRRHATAEERVAIRSRLHVDRERRDVYVDVLSLSPSELVARAPWRPPDDGPIELRFPVAEAYCAAWCSWAPLFGDVFALHFRRVTPGLAERLAVIDRHPDDRHTWTAALIAPRLRVIMDIPTPPIRRPAPRLWPADRLPNERAPGGCTVDRADLRCDQPAAALCERCLAPICRDHARADLGLGVLCPRCRRVASAR